MFLALFQPKYQKEAQLLAQQRAQAAAPPPGCAERRDGGRSRIRHRRLEAAARDGNETRGQRSVRASGQGIRPSSPRTATTPAGGKIARCCWWRSFWPSASAPISSSRSRFRPAPWSRPSTASSAHPMPASEPLPGVVAQDASVSPGWAGLTSTRSREVDDQVVGIAAGDAFVLPEIHPDRMRERAAAIWFTRPLRP